MPPIILKGTAGLLHVLDLLAQGYSEESSTMTRRCYEQCTECAGSGPLLWLSHLVTVSLTQTVEALVAHLPVACRLAARLAASHCLRSLHAVDEASMSTQSQITRSDNSCRLS